MKKKTERIEDAIYHQCGGGIVFKLGEPQHWQLNTLYNKVFRGLRAMALEDSFKGLTEEQVNSLSFEQICGLPGIEPPTLVELDDMGEDEELALRLSISPEKFDEVMKRLESAVNEIFNFNNKKKIMIAITFEEVQNVLDGLSAFYGNKYGAYEIVRHSFRSIDEMKAPKRLLFYLLKKTQGYEEWNKFMEDYFIQCELCDDFEKLVDYKITQIAVPKKTS